MMKTRLSYMVLGWVILWTTGCNSPNTPDDSRPYIVATTGMIADAVSRVTGDFARVEAIMGPGVDPHLYKASKGDLDKLTQADIIFYNGLHLEGKMGEVLGKLGRTKPVIPIADHLPEEKLHRVPQYNNSFDPHIWFDLRLWQMTLPVITRELSKRYPEESVRFTTGETSFSLQLDSLHLWAKKKIEEIPESSRVLVTAHDAFGYFGEAYGMEVRGLQGISTLSEFGLRDRVDLVNMIVDRRIKAVFVETSVPERAINAVVDGCRKKDFDVKIGGYLYSDAMGEAGTQDGTFPGMFVSNIETITEALK